MKRKLNNWPVARGVHTWVVGGVGAASDIWEIESGEAQKPQGYLRMRSGLSDGLLHFILQNYPKYKNNTKRIFFKFVTVILLPLSKSLRLKIPVTRKSRPFKCQSFSICSVYFLLYSCDSHIILMQNS